MSVEVRDDVSRDAFHKVMLLSSGTVADEGLKSLLVRHYDLDVGFGALFDGVLVGTVGLRHVASTFPGGASVPAMGMGQGGVLPTYTRRGILRRLMIEALGRVRDLGVLRYRHHNGLGTLRSVRLRTGILRGVLPREG